MDRTLEANFCFDLVCKVVVEVQKEFSWFTMWTKHSRYIFGLVCKVVLEVQRSSILCIYTMGMPHVQKTREFFCFQIKLTFFMNSFLSYHVILFFFCFLITSSLCYGQTKPFRKFEFFHLDQCQLVSYVNNSRLGVCQCVNSEFFCFGWWTNQRGLSPKGKKCQGCAPKLINTNHTIFLLTGELKLGWTWNSSIVAIYIANAGSRRTVRPTLHKESRPMFNSNQAFVLAQKLKSAPTY
jgi:hypothetical protein